MEQSGVQSRPTGTDGVVEDIITRIAEIEESDPLEMTPLLYQVIDPEALETVLASANNLVQVEFAYHGHHVIVDGEGEIRIEALAG